MACDICGKTGKPLTDLLDSYKTDDIQQVCDGCASAINKHVRKIRVVTTNIHFDLAKRFMRALKGQTP